MRSEASIGRRIASCERLVSSSTSVCETRSAAALADAGAGASGETFLSTLAAVAQSRNPASRIEALSYRNRTMDLQLLAANVAALDQFRTDLGQTQRFRRHHRLDESQRTRRTRGEFRFVGVEPMKTWFFEPARSRTLILLGGAAAAVLVILWAFVLAPLGSGRADLRESVERKSSGC